MGKRVLNKQDQDTGIGKEKGDPGPGFPEKEGGPGERQQEQKQYDIMAITDN